MTANYLRFLAILVSGAYALVVLMPRRIRVAHWAVGRPSKKHICWLPYLQNYTTGNTPYSTGNATHTGNVIFRRYVTGTSAAKAGSPYPQTYFTGTSLILILAHDF
jgi:hypothetical protein